jgi:glycine/D-amino acid oxidase-like deaminating enzyme
VKAAVVGAGVVGAATARALARRGWSVTIHEQYTPGTVRSASGGDTRLLRVSYGEADWYAELAWRARAQWLELQEESGVPIWEEIGVARFAREEDGIVQRSVPALERLGVPHEWLAPADARSLFPSLNIDDLVGVLFEPHAGVLLARRATQLLVEDAQRHGASLEPGRVTPAEPPPADVVVWACGAWLARVFPREVELTVSRREVTFVGADSRWRGVPAFIDDTSYGHGELGGLGVKVSADWSGPIVDPDTLDRVPSAESQAAARAFAAHRFPALAGAPSLGGRVCQYTLTGDRHFLVARHPERPAWWLAGGGSGHAFKHGPAFGEYVADCVEGARQPEPFHGLGPRTGPPLAAERSAS